MIVRAVKLRRRPAFYVRRTMRRVQILVARNPGFHRLVVEINPAGAWDTGWLVNPDVEPELRRLLGKVLVLAPPVEDHVPWAAL